MKHITKKMVESRLYKVGKFILTSAPFAMLLSIAFFWYGLYSNNKESDAMIGNLKQIEQSLSTRHIGIFPDYLHEIINKVSGQPHQIYGVNYPVWGTISITPYKWSAVRGIRHHFLPATPKWVAGRGHLPRTALRLYGVIKI